MFSEENILHLLMIKNWDVGTVDAFKLFLLEKNGGLEGKYRNEKLKIVHIIRKN